MGLEGASRSSGSLNYFSDRRVLWYAFWSQQVYPKVMVGKYALYKVCPLGFGVRGKSDCILYFVIIRISILLFRLKSTFIPRFYLLL